MASLLIYSKMELKKILIEKMESNKFIHRSDEQRNLYKDLVEAYESDKIILDTYGDIVTLKRHRDDDADKDKEPSAGSDRGSKRQREGNEPESTSAPKEKATRITGKSTQGSKSQQKTASESAPAEEPMQTNQDLEEPSHQEFKTGAADDQPITEASQHPEWFQQQKKPPTPDSAWNNTLAATHGSIQPWISDLAKQADSRSSFIELMDTPVDFSSFIMNRLKIDTLTPKLLAGPTYELMKGSCKSLVELEFFLEEPLPLIPNSRGRRVIPFDHFINNNLEYLRGGAFSRKYTTSVTKTNAADYGHLKWIEDLVRRIMWSQEPVSYDKHAIWGISHWGRKCQQFYGFAVNRKSARDVYSKCRIIAVTELQIIEWHNYKHLDWITVRRDDDKKADKSDGRRTLCLQRLSKNVHKKHRHPNACGRPSTRCRKLPKKAQPHKADTYRSDLKRKEAYTAYFNPRGFIYQNKDKQNRLMRIDELHKFNNGTLNDVRTALDDRLKGIQMKYLPQAIWRKSDKERAATMIQAIQMKYLPQCTPYVTSGNPVKKILLKLNLSDHMSILTDLQVTPTKPERMTKPYSSHRFIANCFNAGHLKMEVKAHPAFLLLLLFISCFATASYAHNVHLSALNQSIIVNVTALPTSGQVLRAGVDNITIMWSYNLSFMATAPDTNHTNYNTSRGKLCYAPVSQMGRDDRKTDDLLDVDKTCPVEIMQVPYQRENNSYTWMIPSNTTTATYFVRVYIDRANKHEIAYGQSTNENKTTNLFQIDGVAAPPEPQPQPQPGSAWSLVGSSFGYHYAWLLVLLLV
nr:high-affinity nitrate transporter 3.1-like [Tanacetum cinerariifolium]